MRKRMLMLALAGLATASGAWAKDVAYLGVATEPLDPMTGRHLGLGEGIGLAVAHLDEAGALTGKVEEGDILHKFNDQLLVSPEQLAILVRRETPGTKAVLTVLRSGKSETVEVTLGAIDRARVQPVTPQPGRNGAWGPHVFPMPPPGRQGPDVREWMNDFRRQMRQWRGAHVDGEAEDDEPDEPAARPGQNKAEVHSNSVSVVSETRDGVTVTLTHRDGAKSARIEKAGKVVFDGPVDNEKDLGKVPEEFRGRLGDMRDKVKVEIRTRSESGPAPRGAGRQNLLVETHTDFGERSAVPPPPPTRRSVRFLPTLGRPVRAGFQRDPARALAFTGWRDDTAAGDEPCRISSSSVRVVRRRSRRPTTSPGRPSTAPNATGFSACRARRARWRSSSSSAPPAGSPSMSPSTRPACICRVRAAA